MTISTKIAYHLDELEDAQTPSAAAHNLPVILNNEQSILDVGCGVGQTLVALNLDSAHHLVGVDIEPEPLAYGSEHFTHINYAQARAEQLPFASASFDLILSRVSLPYTNIPVALDEMQRVLTPGGRVWLSLHTQQFTLSQLRDSIKRGYIKDVVFRCYVFANSWSFSLFGKLFRFPLNRKRCESFQTNKSMRKALLKHGFDNIQFKRGRHFEVTAHKVNPLARPLNSDQATSRHATQSPVASATSGPVVSREQHSSEPTSVDNQPKLEEV